MACFVALALGAYVAGYFWLCEYQEGSYMGSLEPTCVRRYPRNWQKRFFYPALWVERRLTDKWLQVSGPEDSAWDNSL
jgi:hypothetical protein